MLDKFLYLLSVKLAIVGQLVDFGLVVLVELAQTINLAGVLYL